GVTSLLMRKDQTRRPFAAACGRLLHRQEAEPVSDVPCFVSSLPLARWALGTPGPFEDHAWGFEACTKHVTSSAISAGMPVKAAPGATTSCQGWERIEILAGH
ncbi:hypothetical protein EMPG_14498, partial [Blastomyces silverae]